MNYKGYEIDDKDYVLVEEKPLMEYDSNHVDFDLEDLEWMANEYKDKKKQLEDSGIDFKVLRLNFTAKDYDYNPNGPDEDAEAKFYFSYYRLETDEEKEKRIKNRMSYIDKAIEQNERLKSASRAVKEYELEKAKKLLEENGYIVTN